MFGLSGASEGTLRYKGPLASEMSVASSELGSVPSLGFDSSRGTGVPSGLLLGCATFLRGVVEDSSAAGAEGELSFCVSCSGANDLWFQ